MIVAPTTPEALAAKALTSTIPIVTATADAVGVGLAASFARPGGNVTGLTAVGGSVKNLGLLSELLPRATRFAVLLDPDNRYHAQTMVGFQNAAAERHLEILPVVKRSVADIGPAFQTMASKGIQGLLVLSDPIGSANRRKIIELAAQNQIPTVYYWRKIQSKVVCSLMAPISATLIVVPPLMLRSCCEARKPPTSRSSRPNASGW